MNFTDAGQILSDKDDPAYNEKRKQPVQPPDISNYRSTMLDWCGRLERSLLTANLKHRNPKGSVTATANDYESSMPLYSSRADTRYQSEQIRLFKLARKQFDVQDWYQGVKDLLETYKVQRLDIVYEDDPSWLMPPTDGSNGTQLPQSQSGRFLDGVTTFVAPEHEKVRRFLRILFGAQVANPG